MYQKAPDYSAHIKTATRRKLNCWRWRFEGLLRKISRRKSLCLRSGKRRAIKWYHFPCIVNNFYIDLSHKLTWLRRLKVVIDVLNVLGGQLKGFMKISKREFSKQTYRALFVKYTYGDSSKGEYLVICSRLNCLRCLIRLIFIVISAACGLCQTTINNVDKNILNGWLSKSAWLAFKFFKLVPTD